MRKQSGFLSSPQYVRVDTDEFGFTDIIYKVLCHF